MKLFEVLQHDVRELEALRAKVRSLENVKLNVGEIIMKTSGILRRSTIGMSLTPSKREGGFDVALAQKFVLAAAENERLTREMSDVKQSGVYSNNKIE